MVTVLRYQAEGYLNAASAGVGDVVALEPFGAIELDVGALFGHE